MPDLPGLYLATILFSALGIGVIDRRYRLAVFYAPLRTLVSVLVGVVFFLAWDVLGIAVGAFAKGTSGFFVGIDVAPEIPLEEPFFLAFLCYLALVVSQAALRRRPRPARIEEDA